MFYDWSGKGSEMGTSYYESVIYYKIISGQKYTISFHFDGLSSPQDSNSKLFVPVHSPVTKNGRKKRNCDPKFQNFENIFKNPKSDKSQQWIANFLFCFLLHYRVPALSSQQSNGFMFWTSNTIPVHDLCGCKPSLRPQDYSNFAINARITFEHIQRFLAFDPKEYHPVQPSTIKIKKIEHLDLCYATKFAPELNLDMRGAMWKLN